MPAIETLSAAPIPAMSLPDPAATPGAREGNDTRNLDALKGARGNPLIWVGLVLGMGFGGFADRTVLHQILARHHLVCDALDCRPVSRRRAVPQSD